MKLNKMPTSNQVLTRQLRDPAFRAEWERTTLARAVATRLVEYRDGHNLTQTALAEQLEMKQPAIARLESGEHNPSLHTLLRIANTLGLEFRIAITPHGIAV